ncbi:MAG: hypothetical protein IJP44_03695 [Bacteroidales bacterium]|nr:hypothetical protein [Bacteroidales bacterium]
MSDVYNEATVSFATKSDNFTPIAKTDTKGRITLHREQGNVGVRWAILLAGTTLPGVSNPVNENDFITDLDFQVQRPNSDLVVKTSTTGEYFTFTVGPNKKVFFSKANLKYTPDTDTWAFHDDQISECKTPTIEEDGGISFVAQSRQGFAGRSYNTTDMDRFSWGYNETTTLDEGGESTEPDFVHGQGEDLSTAKGTDWGCALEGIGNDYWRTPTANDWDTLLYHRGNKSFMMICCLVPTPDGQYYGQCRGLLLFPDGFNEDNVPGLVINSSAELGDPGFNPNLYNIVDFTREQIDWGWGPYDWIEDSYKDSNGNYNFYTNPNSNMYKLLAA